MVNGGFPDRHGPVLYQVSGAAIAASVRDERRMNGRSTDDERRMTRGGKAQGATNAALAGTKDVRRKYELTI